MSSSSGSITTSVNLVDAIAASTTILNAYSIPVTPSVSSTYTNGSAASMVSKIYTRSASLVATTIDLSLAVLVCLDDSIGFTNVREVLIFNDDATAAGAKILTVGLGTFPFNYWLGGTTPTLIVHPGTCMRLACPIQTAGWLVDGTHDIIRLNSGANTVAYRVIIAGN